MVKKQFFEESSAASKVKSSIVAQYYAAWSNVMLSKANSDRLGYIDLYCGPGKYEDGTLSTPLLILNSVLGNSRLCQKQVFVFNDKDKENIEKLQANFNLTPGVSALKHNPTFNNEEVGDSLTKYFSNTTLVPSLVFVDPFGYKGLTLHLLHSVFKDWGCDCVFFFNFNRINMGITNKTIRNRMSSLFGEENFQKLRIAVIKRGMTPETREKIIIEHLQNAIRSKGGKYFLPFRFIKDTKVSHYLIFVSKDVLGYNIMKDIMANKSLQCEDGIPFMEHHYLGPKQERNQQGQVGLFDAETIKPPSRMPNLMDSLATEFKGKTISVGNIISDHYLDKPYISKNYREALRRLEAGGKVTVNHSKKRVVRNGVLTMPDEALVTFK